MEHTLGPGALRPRTNATQGAGRASACLQPQRTDALAPTGTPDRPALPGLVAVVAGPALPVPVAGLGGPALRTPQPMALGGQATGLPAAGPCGDERARGARTPPTPARSRRCELAGPLSEGVTWEGVLY
jgi:hypothetical protein